MGIPIVFDSFVKTMEGLKLDPYYDGAGILTIYYGHVCRSGEVYLHTMDDAIKYLNQDADIACTAVERFVTVPINDNEKAALISFTYNAGVTAFIRSILLQLLNKDDRTGASSQFLAWNKIRVKGILTVSQGLMNRRVAERALFLKAV